MNIRKVINKLLCKHNYVFVNQQIIAGGMDKLITRKCNKCGKVRAATLNQW